MPYWWKVFRSAWMPAPPEGSEPAMVRAMGMLLSPDLKHLAILGEDAFVETVAHRFEVNGFIEDFADGFGAVFAKLFFDVHFVVIQQAEMQLALGCQAHAVAASAIGR